MASWVAAEDLKELLGQEAAEALMQKRGGVDIFVPQKITAEHALAKLLGVAAAARLCNAYAQTYITVPNGRKQKPKNGAARELLAKGVPARDVALELGLTERYVRDILARARETPEQASLFSLLE